MIHSEKIKAVHEKGCVKEWFCKLTAWHLSTSLQINFFADNFEGFLKNECLRMATSRSCIKCLKSSFLLYLVVEILQLVHEVSSFPYRQGIFPRNLTLSVTLNLEVSDQRPCEKDQKVELGYFSKCTGVT